MSDLPIASTPPVCAAPERPAANTLLRGASPFQEALTLELEQGKGPDAASALDPALSPAPSSVLAPRHRGTDTEEDPALVAAATDVLPGIALSGLPALPPLSAPVNKAAVPTASRASLTLAAGELEPGLPGSAARKTAPGYVGPDAKAGAKLALDAAAADFAAPGKFASAAEGAFRREAALAAGLLDQHKAAAPPPQAGSAAPAPAAALPVAAPAIAVQARVGDRGWDQGLGDKLVWMAGHKQQTAELHLNPPELGPLKITLTLNDDQASAQFVSAHAAVREAIETAMPRLREMLADSGISLGNANVSADASYEQHEERAYSAGDAATASADAVTVERGERVLRSLHGLVDTFA